MQNGRNRWLFSLGGNHNLCNQGRLREHGEHPYDVQVSRRSTLRRLSTPQLIQCRNLRLLIGYTPLFDKLVPSPGITGQALRDYVHILTLHEALVNLGNIIFMQSDVHALDSRITSVACFYCKTK